MLNLVGFLSPPVCIFAGLLTALGTAPPSTAPATKPAAEPNSGGTPVRMIITSKAFAANQPIPRIHTGDGQDQSPELAWSGVPSEAVELALICDDPDAPRPEPWVHWVIYKIPVSAAGLKANIEAASAPKEPAGALQGKNSWNTIGYRGPMPPPGHGPHHYRFRLYALDTRLSLPAARTKDQLAAAMKGHILAEAEIVGTYTH
jgi:Raf kinase inhibitor-like YbhB/YbcL family protein